MRRWFIRLAVVAGLAGGTSLALAFSTGPPASRTGAPAVGGVVAEGVCTACHTTFPLNTPGATLELLDVPSAYMADSTYTLRVRLSSTFPAPRRWGFQITAVRQADGQGVGTFNTGGSPLMQIVNGAGAFASRRYVEHTSAGTFDNDLGPVEWSFAWRAPNSDVGPILFFAAGNAANSSDTNAGDHIYTTSDTAQFSPPVDVPGAPLLALDALAVGRPNPFRESTTLRYSLALSGPVDLAVFDTQGRRVRSLVSGDRAAGAAQAVWDGRGEDGSRAVAGVYFVRLSAPALSSPLTRRLVLIR
jgi:hypothetical protein